MSKEKKKIIVKKILPKHRVDALNHLKELSFLTPLQAEELEKSINKYVDNFITDNSIQQNSEIHISLYKTKFMNIIVNINPESYVGNTHLKTLISEPEFDISTIVSMPAYDMAPDTWKFYEATENAIIKSITEGNSTAIKTELFTCSRCKQKKCHYFEKQVRSADEPATLFITCDNCHKKWTQ